MTFDLEGLGNIATSEPRAIGGRYADGQIRQSAAGIGSLSTQLAISSRGEIVTFVQSTHQGDTVTSIETCISSDSLCAPAGNNGHLDSFSGTGNGFGSATSIHWWDTSSLVSPANVHFRVVKSNSTGKVSFATLIFPG